MSNGTSRCAKGLLKCDGAERERRREHRLTGANSNQPLIRALYGATEPLVRPFQGIFALLIVALVRAITNPKRA